MTKLKKYHDLSTFCAAAPLGNGNPMDHVKFDAKTKTLVACDGKVAIVVPVDAQCDAPDALIPKDRIAEAASKDHDLAVHDGKLTLNKKAVVTDGKADVTKFGNVFSVLNAHEPDLLIPLDIDTIGPLLSYAKKNGDGGLYLSVNFEEGTNWQERKINGAIHFMFDMQQQEPTTGDNAVESVQVVGALMPCTLENQQAIHSRLRAAIALANAGMTEKDKAAAARKKAAAKKAAKAKSTDDAATTTKAKRAKAKAAEVEDDEETEVDDVPTPVPAPPKNGKGKAKAANAKPSSNGKAPASTATKPKPKPAKSESNGDGCEIADLLTRARASISRGKLAAAKRALNKAREEVLAGNVDAKYGKSIDELLASILKGRR